MDKINNFEQKYMEKSWGKETHQSYKTTDIDDSIKDFNLFLKSNRVSGSLLDIGCGNGKNTIYFQKNNFDSFGIDFSNSAIKICKQTAKELNINPIFKTGSALDFSSKNQFNVIIDCGCLHHIRRQFWNKYKKTILKNLKIGGYYYLHGISNSDENKKLPKHPNKRNWIINKKGHYTTFFSKEDISKLFGNKFKIIKTYDFKSKNSPLMVKTFYIQRLKGINQAGASQYAVEGKTVTRYEHSLGVMILLKKFGASIEEQIAGLLHDIPHTAFSHVIDFVFKDANHNHEFHEKFHERIILQSEIPAILKKFDFDIDRLLDEHNFPLLEKSLPNLCADRIDYTLRDMVASEGFSDKINKYISSFVVQNNEIIIRGGVIAKSFSEDYLRMDEEKWSHPLEVALFQILADAIKIALDEKILNEKDLFEDDLFVYTKLEESGNKLILKKLEMLNPNLKIINDPNDFLFHSRNKLRYINPKFLNSDGSIRRVADKFKDFSDKLVKHEELIKKGNFVKIVSY